MPLIIPTFAVITSTFVVNLSPAFCRRARGTHPMQCTAGSRTRDLLITSQTP